VTDIATQAHDQTGKAPEELAGLAGNLLSSALGSAALPEIERRFERLKSERDAAGPVNLRAHEELTETQERVATLAREKEDVAQAVTKLRRAITTLNNEGRARLLRAFEEVDAHFAQLFATLFEGGQAALKLTESEDPLEAGLEIFAQPPGKRLTNLSLLSGGEQALTATALIFAVFLANPAPLCVLDEVDAPLDDANVDRFCRMLEEMKRLTTTRFIVITHNPVTMSRMDRLYGVTMPEQGLSQLVSVDLGRAQALAAE
jgi:chromosome segregation protein